MSESKRDRSVVGRRRSSRPSRAREVADRNIAPPAPVPRAARKPKKGARVMDAQLAAREPTPSASVPQEETRVSDETVPPADPWWTPEREGVFKMVLSGIPQHQIANDLGRDRHTVARWTEDERFAARLAADNLSRFASMRQRRAMQTVRLTDKAFNLAETVMDAAIEHPTDLPSRLAARDWLQEFREMSRREDEVYGLDKQRVDVNVRGGVTHEHRGKVDLSFKEFITGSLRRMGVDPDAEVIDVGRADEALVATAERALMEGTFLDELVERERAEQLAAAER